MQLVDDDRYRRIRKQLGRAIGDFNLIEAGDRIAVGVSGGKDSYTLLHTLDHLRRRAPVKFELVAINIDAGFPGYRKETIEAHLRDNGFTYRMKSTNSYRIIEEKRRARLLLLLLLRPPAARGPLCGGGRTRLQQDCSRVIISMISSKRFCSTNFTSAHWRR